MKHEGREGNKRCKVIHATYNKGVIKYKKLQNICIKNAERRMQKKGHQQELEGNHEKAGGVNKKVQ